VLVDVRDGVRSPIELDYLRDVERAHGLPVGQRQFARRNTEADVYYTDYGLLVELDGRLTVAMPGSEVTAEPALDAIRRLARAVGAPPDRFTVALRL
jgi:hypothetical protein